MLEMLVDARNELGEGALWCERTGRVLWTDINRSVLWAYHPASGSTQSWPMPERLGSFALTTSDDRLLLGLASRLAFFDFSSGEVTTVCEIEPGLGTRMNDGRCDRQGRFVFGTFNEAVPKEAIGGFYRLNHDLSLDRLDLPKVAIANSICFSPDGTIMYYADSPEKAIRCCDYDTETGAVSAPRVFAVLEGEGEPDGSCIDAEGYLWNAQWGGSRVVRYAPDGSIEHILAVPAVQPSCVAIGGPGMDVVYVTSARVGMELPAPQDGGLFAKAMDDIRGLPESRFRL
ncbi:SMP-30/gluconolactonase/LRE family protein [Massilia cavernae]|uniref:SMP-30/gluconolactonase/LRE family protein n=1 Tax=Massilia cavernae TaxID=2320864 RepID=A0A418Y6Y1_9BURK|nr:SMP-30/gluconolactonase/LRE family protein [Massilia cavernae]RJG24376.1 SMP-30/gluconolactonase/LRE family protein [Massilia cavernae]